MTDEALEAAIDKAGRDAVLARARTYGWGAANPPPKWVWWQIIEELKAGPTAYPRHMPDSRPLHEQITGLRIW